MRSHTILWLVVLVSVLLFAPLVVSSDDYKATIGEEIDSAQNWYGPGDATAIIGRADTIYRWLFVKTGVDFIIRDKLSSDLKPTEIAPGVAAPKALTPYTRNVADYWSNFRSNLWLICYRVAVAVFWLLYLSPFVAATLFDGAMTRKAKLASFKYTSPTVHSFSWHAAIGVLSITVVAFSLHFPLSVFAYPAAIAGMALLIRLVITNIQHSA